MATQGMTTKMVLIMEYDGKRYHGFQLQAALPTIQGETEKALWQLTGERTRVLGASRTDAGVHARGQVVGFRTGSRLRPASFVNGLNYYLPRDIAVKVAYKVDDSFDVRRDAVSREYSYYILNSLTRSPTREDFTYLVGHPLNFETLGHVCNSLVGRHDFASFTTGDGVRRRNTMRTVYRADVVADGDLAVFNMVADSFLPHQVRNTIGALIRVGSGRMNVDEFYSIAAAKTPGLAGPTAPAHALCLMRVNYPRPFGELDR
ncbi:tRNA pseudouridine(38-40) synthase TruA [Chloroflexota bacterium]